MRMIISAIPLLFLAAGAQAGTLTIDFPDTDVEEIAATYVCAGEEKAVTYINAGATSLAVLKIDDETYVMANVVSGSGARYAGGRYVWWSKGDSADLYDEMGDDDGPILSCAVDEPASD